MHPKLPAQIALFCLAHTFLTLQNHAQVVVTPFSGGYVKSDQDFADLARTEHIGNFDRGGADDDIRLVLPFSEKSSLAPRDGYNGPAFYGAYQVDSFGGKTAATFKFQSVQSGAPADRITLAVTSSEGFQGGLAGFFMFDVDRAPDRLLTLSIGGDGGESEMLDFRYMVRSGSSYYLSKDTFSDLSRVNTTDFAKQGWADYDPNPELSKGAGLHFDADSAKFLPLTDEDLRGVDRMGVFFQNRRLDLGSGAVMALSSLSYTHEAAAVPEPEEYAFWTGLGLLGLAWYRRRRTS
jgi:hypothetical protein